MAINKVQLDQIEDGNLVHKTGTETISGKKTFTGGIDSVLISAPNPGLTLFGTAGSAGWRRFETYMNSSSYIFRYTNDAVTVAQNIMTITPSSATAFNTLLNFNSGASISGATVGQLTLNGNAAISGGLKIGSSSSSGQVWTATDAVGNGSWQALTNGFLSGVLYAQVNLTGSGYPTLSGTPNGSNTSYTVPGGSYPAGTGELYINGVLMSKGTDWTETTPTSGIFTTTVAWATGTEILFKYLTASGSSSVPNYSKIVNSQASTSTLTPDPVTYSEYELTGQAVALTIADVALAPDNATYLSLTIRDNGTARAITWGSSYVGVTVALPTTTTAGKTMYALFRYSSARTRWELISVDTEL